MRKLIQRVCQLGQFEDRLVHARDRLYRVAFAWCHDGHLADDLVQDTCAKALRRRSQLRDMETMDAWLFRILHNCWYDFLRAGRDTVVFDEADFPDTQTPEGLHMRLDSINSVRLAIAALPMGQRQVVTLVDLERFSYAEVAEIVEVPIGTVMSRLCRARKALRQHIGDQREAGAGKRMRRVK